MSENASSHNKLNVSNSATSDNTSVQESADITEEISLKVSSLLSGSNILKSALSKMQVVANIESDNVSSSHTAKEKDTTIERDDFEHAISPSNVG